MAAKVYHIPADDTESIPGGFYIKARKIEDSEIAHAAPVIREVWDWLLRQANHKDNPTLNIKRGQCVRRLADMQEGLHWYVGYRKMTYSKSQCEGACEWLRERSMITTVKTTRGMLITICKYDSYNRLENYEANNEKFTNPTRNQQHADTINKNDNNVKNVNIEANASSGDAISEIIISQRDLGEMYRNTPQTKEAVEGFIKKYRPQFINPYAFLWNAFAEKNGFPRIKDLTDDRKRKIKTRIREDSFDLAAILLRAQESAFMTPEKTWFSFDWVIANQKNYIKVLEGNYGKREPIILINKTDADEIKRRQQENIERQKAKYGG